MNAKIMTIKVKMIYLSIWLKSLLT